MDEETAENIVDHIIEDLQNRKGFRQLWESTDEDLQQEIRDKWTQIIVGSD